MILYIHDGDGCVYRVDLKVGVACVLLTRKLVVFHYFSSDGLQKKRHSIGFGRTFIFGLLKMYVSCLRSQGPFSGKWNISHTVVHDLFCKHSFTVVGFSDYTGRSLIFFLIGICSVCSLCIIGENLKGSNMFPLVFSIFYLIMKGLSTHDAIKE